MRPAFLRCVAAALCAAALTACTGGPAAPAPAALSDSRSPQPLSQPFQLLITGVDAQAMGNGEIVGGPPDVLNPEAVRIAVEASRATLEGYLNAQFVVPESRFSAGPAEGLLSPRAAAGLDDATRRALGQLDLSVDGAVTGAATAQAVVLVDGPAAYGVTLAYEARLEVTWDDGSRAPLVQRGVITFVPLGGTYRADALEVTLEAPTPPAEPSEGEGQP